MGTRWLASVVFTCFWLVSVRAVGQPEASLEARIRELERKVSVLEARIGISSTPEASASRSSSLQPAAGRMAAPEASAARSEYPVSVYLTEKTLQEKGPGEDSDQLGFQFVFKNVGSEHLTSFEGDIELHDYTGELLHTFSFDIAKYLTVGGTTMWYSSISFRAVHEIHRRLYTASLEDLRLVLKLRQVMYYDTRVERFN